MVVDNGQIIEYDSPQKLLENQNGAFYNYIKKSGLLQTADQKLSDLNDEMDSNDDFKNKWFLKTNRKDFFVPYQLIC